MVKYPYYCNTCWRVGTEDDGIEGVGSDCPDEDCDGTIRRNTPREFWPWREITSDCKRESSGEREVLTESFLREPVWVPWMGDVE